ncbi:MAG: glutaredoxin 3 [Gammaproteobacteria bacterium]|nr:glutaredoxin 3 [Gammaproteobacteria bacterium]
MNASRKVVVYTGNRCAYCNAAKRLLDSKGAVYTEINVDENPASREEMMARSRRQTVPQIFIGDRHVGGFDDLSEMNQSGTLDELLSP